MIAQERFALGCRTVELGFDFGDRRRIACLAGRPVTAQFVDGHAPPFDLLPGRQDAVFFVAVDQVVDARHECVGVAEAHQREQFGDVDLEIESVVVVGALLLGAQNPDGGERRALLALVEGFHGRQFHGLHASHDGT